MAEKVKDPVKQQAGRLGAKVRWQNTLKWLRRLVEIRGGNFGRDWRVNLQGVTLMYVMLRRTTLPSLRGRRKRRKDQEIELALAQAIEARKWATVRRAITRLEHRPNVSLPPSAREELESLNQHCDTQLSLENIEAIASFSDGRQCKFPWIHSNWRYETLERVLKVNGDEIEKLEPLRRPRKKRMSREASKLRRQAAVLGAFTFLKRKGEPTSIRQVQRMLKRNYQLDLSCETVRRYLNSLPKR